MRARNYSLSSGLRWDFAMIEAPMATRLDQRRGPESSSGKSLGQRSDAVALLTLNLLLLDLETRAIAVLPLVLPVLRGEFCIVQFARRNLSPMGEMFVRTLLEVDAEVAQLEQLAARILFPAKQRRAEMSRS